MSETYAAYSEFIDIRRQSSSGGIFYHLAKTVIEAGGVVFGAAWNKDWLVDMKSADTLSGIEAFMKSKYVKANIGNTFAECRSYLDAGRLVLYTGTPCQITALKTYLKKDYLNLFAVEVCCHGTMPTNIWLDYLNSLTSVYGNILSINMRDKVKGWHSPTVTITFSSGKVISESFKDNLYMKAFLSDKYLTKACYSCPFKNEHSKADLCIGDFWNIREHYSKLDDNSGCSFITVNTTAGKYILSRLTDIRLEQIDSKDILKLNGGTHNNINTDKICTYDHSIFSIAESTTTTQQAISPMKEKLGIVTLHLHSNIGGVLQAYALQQTLKNIGYDSDVITWDVANDKTKHLKFVDTNIKTRTLDAVKKYKDIKSTDYTGFIVGSDQIWRKKYSTSFFGDNYLQFAKNWPVKKIVYGASLGVGAADWEYSPAEGQKISEWLKDFSYISCRELDGEELIRNKFNAACTNVCDPTMLLPKETYLELCSDIKQKSGDVFTYILDNNTSIENTVKTFLYKNKLTEMKCDKNSVEDWLAAFRDCKYVITDSFHGCVFSLIFNKPFICVINKARGTSRFATLISKFNLSNNFIFDWVSLTTRSFIASNSNYEDYAKDSRYWLKTAIEKAVVKTRSTVRTEYIKTAHGPKVALCGIGKIENNYIREWVEHYNMLGFNKIFLYDNNDKDGEHFEDVIGDYVNSGYVEILDVRGEPDRQISAYNELYQSDKLRGFDWIAYFDIDEFLELDTAKNIQEFVSDQKFSSFNSIAINWKYYDDNGLVEVTDGNYSCLERFTHEYSSDSRENTFTKRITRTNIPGVVINSSHGPLDRMQANESKYCETLKNPNINCCNVEGKKLYQNGTSISNWTHNGAHLKHFRFKTIEEYIINKMKRGYPTLYKNCGKDLNIIDFFLLNDITTEKKQKAAACLGYTITQIDTILRSNPSLSRKMAQGASRKDRNSQWYGV